MKRGSGAHGLGHGFTLRSVKRTTIPDLATKYRLDCWEFGPERMSLVIAHLSDDLGEIPVDNLNGTEGLSYLVRLSEMDLAKATTVHFAILAGQMAPRVVLAGFFSKKGSPRAPVFFKNLVEYTIPREKLGVVVGGVPDWEAVRAETAKCPLPISRTGRGRMRS